VKLTIGYLYPDLMNLYGDRGNVICLIRRCQWRGIEVEVREVSLTSDLLFMGGGPDRRQKIVAEDLKGKRG